jgi:phosphatidate cytidylyltransferase
MSVPFLEWQALGPVVQGTIAGIVAVLVLATAAVRVLQWRRPERDWTELRQRVNSWWIIAAVFLLAIVAPRGVSIAFFAFVSFLALKEYFSVIPTRRADRRVLFWAYLAIPVQFYWVAIEWYGMFIIFIPVFMFLLLPLRMVAIGQTEGYLRAVGSIHWGLMTMVFSLSHAAFLLILQLKDAPDGDPLPGPGLVLYLVVLTQLNDVFQYLWGKSLGRRKIVPSVSPGKTWAGFLGGVATTTALATLAGPHFTPMDYVQSLIAGLIIGVGGFVGDVSISALKRDLGIKDSGSLLPGHGGILDRIDSLTYTAPLFFHYIYWLIPFHTFGSSPSFLL